MPENGIFTQIAEISFPLFQECDGDGGGASGVSGAPLFAVGFDAGFHWCARRRPHLCAHRCPRQHPHRYLRSRRSRSASASTAADASVFTPWPRLCARRCPPRRPTGTFPPARPPRRQALYALGYSFVMTNSLWPSASAQVSLPFATRAI